MKRVPITENEQHFQKTKRGKYDNVFRIDTNFLINQIC